MPASGAGLSAARTGSPHGIRTRTSPTARTSVRPPRLACAAMSISSVREPAPCLLLWRLRWKMQEKYGGGRDWGLGIGGWWREKPPHCVRGITVDLVADGRTCAPVGYRACVAAERERLVSATGIPRTQCGGFSNPQSLSSPPLLRFPSLPSAASPRRMTEKRIVSPLPVNVYQKTPGRWSQGATAGYTMDMAFL